MSRNRAKAEAAARRLTDRMRGPLPVDVFDLARREGVRVLKHPMKDEHSGMLLTKDGKAVIVVNARHHPRRQRFSVAHELGHLVLHPRAGHRVGDDVELFHRHEYHRRNMPQETQANYFAAAILMPEGAVRDAADELELDLVSDRDVQTLAREFDVSVAAMTIRLQNLGLIAPQGHW